MYIKQLECFVHLAETLNFARTAEMLYITQPTVSYQIKTLEEELGIKLFLRSKRKVELTPAGISLYNDMKEILTKTNNAITKAMHFGSLFESNISVGYEGNNEVKYLPDILRAFREKFPHVHLYLKIADFNEKRNFFADNNLDIIFTVKEAIKDIEDVCFDELFQSKFVCVMPYDYPLAQKDLITTEDLRDQSLVFKNPIMCPPEMEKVQRYVQLKCPIAKVYFSDHAPICYTMIKGGCGIAVMPDFIHSVDPTLTIIPLDIQDILSYGIAWHKNNERKEIKGFISLTKQIYKLKLIEFQNL